MCRHIPDLRRAFLQRRFASMLLASPGKSKSQLYAAGIKNQSYRGLRLYRTPPKTGNGKPGNGESALQTSNLFIHRPQLSRNIINECLARSRRAALRAWRRGSGVRQRPVTAMTTLVAVSGLVRHAACTARGGEPCLVRNQQPTVSSPIRKGELAPRSSAGQDPSAKRGFRVTPIVGKDSRAPKCSASPARRG